MKKFAQLTEGDRQRFLSLLILCLPGSTTHRTHSFLFWEIIMYKVEWYDAGSREVVI